MPYLPDPDDSAAPLNTEYAASAAQEFRTLKAKVNNFFLNSQANANENSNRTNKGLNIFNIGGTDLASHFALTALASRTTGTAGVYAGFFSATLGPSLTVDVGGNVRGILVQANTSPVDSFCNILYGADIITLQACHQGQDFVIGQRIRFQDRDTSLDGGAVVGGIGDDKFNHFAVGLMFEAQARSTATEKCGWSRGIRFEDFSLDEDDSIGVPQAIDFTGISQTAAAGIAIGAETVKSVAFHFNTDSLLSAVGLFTNAGAVVMPTVVEFVLPVMIDGIVVGGIPICSIV